MKITLFWRDKNWHERGYANHIWLSIFPNKKSYTKTISMYESIGALNVVEVRRKTDIEDMITYLDAQGYHIENIS